jgi:uncharacterized Zn ribbon protein
MPRCMRCGTEYVRRTMDDRYCSRCEVEVAALTAPRPAPAVRWRRESRAKDLTESMA